MKKLLLVLVAVFSILIVSCSGSSSNDRPETSSGYKEDFEPTVNKDGDYHTINGDAKQVQYQGSQEQKNDLDAIDKYAAEHPGF